MPSPAATPAHARPGVVLAAGLIAGIAGIAVGAGVALLFAPSDGIDTRRALARRRRRLSQKGQDAWDELRDEFRRALRRRRRARARTRDQAHGVGSAS